MVAIGTQRLAHRSPDEVRAVLERAVTLGVDWLDAADIYGPDLGDAERQLASVAGRVRIVTKGGLVPRGKGYRPDGRASHLIAAAEASRARLGVDRLDAFLLHAPDPRTPLRTSVRALARLVDRGIAASVGIANVTVGQLHEALDLAPIAFVQVPFSPFDATSARSGILEACRAAAIPVLAHRALGGADRIARIRRHPVLVALARERGVTPAELVLTWITSLGLIPLPGPSRIESLHSCVRAVRASLDDEARNVLDRTFVEGGRLRVPRAVRAPPDDGPREVRLVLGSPGAGKSSHAARYVEAGHARLNRDERGGTLRGLLKPLATVLANADGPSVVLDNTYPSRAQRYDVIEVAWAHGVPVRATWLDTPPEDCERNAIERMLDRLGRLPEPEEIDTLNASDPAILPPRALLGYRGRFELPNADEGLASIERVPFVRRAGSGAPGVLLDPAGLAAFAPALSRAQGAGFVLLVIGWAEGVDAATRARELEAEASAYGLTVHAAVCPHPGGPPTCWCRKPWLGLPIRLAHDHGVCLDRSVVVVGSRADRTLADKLGIPAVDTAEALDAYVTADP
ncbi:MAG: aldo/keto reductase [Myxococcota bacterium]